MRARLVHFVTRLHYSAISNAKAIISLPRKILRVEKKRGNLLHLVFVGGIHVYASDVNNAHD